MEDNGTYTGLDALFQDISAEIKAKLGSSAPAKIKAADFPEKIRAIDTDPSEGTTATANDVLYNKTAYSNKQPITGTIQTWQWTQRLPDYLCFTANTAGSTIQLNKSGNPTLGQSFSTSTDAVTWADYTPGTLITLLAIGDKVYFKGNNPNGVNESMLSYYRFAMTGSIAASGNIMSLIDNGSCTSTAIPNAECFWGLFASCKALISAPKLPATTLTKECYLSMFNGCTSLTTPPALPATTLDESCYRYMFAYCNSLTVSKTSGTGYDKAWTIPTSGTFTNDSTQHAMFQSCAGTRSDDDLDASQGRSRTYYTQNEPV